MTAYQFIYGGQVYFVEWISAYRGHRDYAFRRRGDSMNQRICEERRSSWTKLERRAVAEVKRAERASLRAMCKRHGIPYDKAMRILKESK